MNADALELRHVLPRKVDGSPYTFMVVDDSEFMVTNLTRIIASFEAEVVGTAGDGAEAVTLYCGLAAKPDLITMDLTMPRVGGLDAIRLIQKEQPQQKIVVVSALGQKEIVQQAMLLGARHFVVKPFQRDDVYRVFRTVLTRGRGAAEGAQ